MSVTLDSSYFNPGTILWLPRIDHVNDLATLARWNTVPEQCFGHPVLVLGDMNSTESVTVLIVRRPYLPNTVPLN